MRCAASSRNCSISASLRSTIGGRDARSPPAPRARPPRNAIVDAVAAARRLAFNPVKARDAPRHAPTRGRLRSPAYLETSCAANGESGQKRQKASARGAVSGTSSPVMTHERVIGSLRNSMAVRKTSLQTARQLRLLTDFPSPFFATFALAFAFFAVEELDLSANQTKP